MWIEGTVQAHEKNLIKSRLARALWIEGDINMITNQFYGVEARESLVDRRPTALVRGMRGYGRGSREPCGSKIISPVFPTV